jgi:hypothetical protein
MGTLIALTFLLTLEDVPRIASPPTEGMLQ